VIIRRHINPTLGDCPLGAVTKPMVQTLVNDWSARYAPSTVHRHYETLHAIFAAAVESDRLARTPCRGIKLPERVKEHRHVVTAEELEALASALPDRYRPLPYLGAVLGLRIGECAGLKLRSVDVLARTVTVSEQLTRGEGGRPPEGPPKSDAGVRVLAIPAWLAEELALHLRRQGLTAADRDAYVFTMPGGGPIDYSRFRRRVWIPACVAAGLGELHHEEADEDAGGGDDDQKGATRYVGLTFHDLRRAASTALVEAGVDVGTAKDRLGHSDVRLTLEVYRQASQDADRAAAEKVGARYRPEDPVVPSVRHGSATGGDHRGRAGR
jgi:integrase